MELQFNQFARSFVKCDINFHRDIFSRIISDFERGRIMSTGEVFDGQEDQKCCHNQGANGKEAPSGRG